MSKLVYLIQCYLPLMDWNYISLTITFSISFQNLLFFPWKHKWNETFCMCLNITNSSWVVCGIPYYFWRVSLPANANVSTLSSPIRQPLYYVKWQIGNLYLRLFATQCCHRVVILYSCIQRLVQRMLLIVYAQSGYLPMRKLSANWGSIPVLV